LWGVRGGGVCRGSCSARAAALAAVFWIAAAGPGGATGVITTAILCSLFGGQEQPVKITVAGIATMLIAFIPVFGTVFGLLPMATDFVSMSVALAPLLLACGVVVARQPLGFLPVAHFAIGSNISNVMNYDLSAFLNTSIAIFMGMGFAL